MLRFRARSRYYSHKEDSPLGHPKHTYKMDNKTTVQAIKDKVAVMRSARGWHMLGREIATSLSLEAAELLEHFQWENSEAVLKDKKIKGKGRREMEMEVADVLVYLAEFANVFEIDLSAVLEKKLKIIDKKYPVKHILKKGRDFYFAQKRKYRRRK